MPWDRIGRIALIGVATTALATLGLSLVLTATYRPSLAQTWDDVLAGPPSSSNDALRAQGALAVPMVLLALTAGAIAVAAAVRRGPSRNVVTASVGALATSAGALASALTLGAVQWDQLALWAVTVGANADGYGTAAFGDGIRFVLVDNVEVSQAVYRTVLLVHLAGPVVALAGMATLWRVARQPDSASPASTPAHAA